MTVTQNDRRIVAAFGAGALCVLILPKFFTCILGVGLLLGAGYGLTKYHCKE